MLKNYQPFSKFIIRTPILSLDKFLDLVKKENISNDELFLIFQEPLVKEAIYLASEELYFEIERSIVNWKNVEKSKQTFIKYLSRMSSRCTPFGMFSGVSIGSISNKTEVVKKISTNFKRKTYIDYDIQYKVVQKLLTDSEILDKILFFPNNSIYESYGELRFVESIINSRGKSEYNISSVEETEILKILLEKGREGLLLSTYINLVIESGYDKESSEKFIKSLINEQILISEIEPVISRVDNYENLIIILKARFVDAKLIEKLENIKNSYSYLDENLINNVFSYEKIISLIENLIEEPLSVKDKFMVDISSNFINVEVGNEIPKKILDTLIFLAKPQLLFNKDNNVTNLDKIKKFLKDRNIKEISLNDLFDPTSGVKSVYDNGSKILDDFLNNIPLSKLHYSENNKNIWNIFLSDLFQNIEEANFIGSKVLNLNKKIFDKINIKTNSSGFNTFYAIVELFEVDGNIKCYLSGSGGSSASNLITRFGFLDESIDKFIHEIVEKEDELEKNAIVAEIIHSPKFRISNILKKSIRRNYEILYYSNSNLAIENKIYIDDLYLKYKEDNLKLFSKTLDKEIIPKLSSAHNYKTSPLAIYKFLCDMQYQNKINSLSLSLGFLSNEYIHIPRIEFNDIILYRETWNFRKSHFKEINVNLQKEDLIDKIRQFRLKYRIPKHILLSSKNSDNELLINLENYDMIIIFLNEIKNKNFVKLHEFFYSDINSESIVKDDNNNTYSNQIIFPFYKND